MTTPQASQSLIAPALVDWDSLDAGKYRDETETVRDLLAAAPLNPEDRAAVRAEAGGRAAASVGRGWSRTSFRSFPSPPRKAWP
jgi:hypothetical protein